MKKGQHWPAKLKFWRRHIEKWQSTDLSQKQYCARHRLHPKSFGYWKQILARLASSSTPLPTQDAEALAEPDRLIPLSVVPDATAGCQQSDPSHAGIQLHVSGYTIDLAVGFHTGTLRTLLEALA